MLRLGIDLGGTKTELIAVDSAGEILLREREPTPADDYDAIVECVYRLIVEAERSLGREGSIGIAAPGAVSPRTGLIKNSNTTVLNGKRLDRDLARRLGREIRIENDANCFALSEAIDGAGAQRRVVFGVILGTGVGGGVIVDGRIVRGHNLIAGEWGHNPLPWSRPDEQRAGEKGPGERGPDEPCADEQRPGQQRADAGPACYCGRRGCLETYLSGPGMSRDFHERAGIWESPEAIIASARGGDPFAAASLTAYIDRLARGLATVINVLDPDVVVLGGGLSNISELYRDVPPLLATYAFSDGVDTPIVPAKHGDSSGVRGAAWLWS